MLHFGWPTTYSKIIKILTSPVLYIYYLLTCFLEVKNNHKIVYQERKCIVVVSLVFSVFLLNISKSNLAVNNVVPEAGIDRKITCS